MRNLIASFTLPALGCGAAFASPAVPANAISGDYVEARTASVFAGACHYNGELTTAGREAEMVWHITKGAWNGVSLDGLNAMAAVVSEENLGIGKTARRSVLYIDIAATTAQAHALTSALKSKAAAALGTVAEVKRVMISFKREGENYRVAAKGIGALSVDALPNRECCKMPNSVWYGPFVALKDRRVGFTVASGINEKSLNANWSRSEENSAFYGSFSL